MFSVSWAGTIPSVRAIQISPTPTTSLLIQIRTKIVSRLPTTG